VEPGPTRLIIIVNDINEFNEINSKIHTGLARDHSDYTARCWCDPVRHAEDGRIAIIIKDNIKKYLNVSEKGRIVDFTDDWCPDIETTHRRI